MEKNEVINLTEEATIKAPKIRLGSLRRKKNSPQKTIDITA